MNIRQIAATDASTGSLLDNVMRYSPILDKKIEFFTGNGDGSTQRKEQGGLEIQARAVDAAYTSKVLAPAYFPVGRKIFGDSVKVDVIREDWGSDIPSEFEGQLRRIAPGIANKFHQLLINGDADTTATDFNGLKKITPNGQIITAATNGHTVTLGNDTAAKTSQQKFLELLDELIGTCLGVNKVVIMNAKAHARLTTVAREFIQWTETTFGKKIAIYNGVELINIEEGGTSVIPFTETVGSANDTASIYVASFEERAGLSFFTSPNGFRVHEMVRVANHFEKMVDFTVDSALFRDKSVARLRGIKFS